MKAFITSLQQQKHNQRTSLLQCNQIMSARVCIMRKRTHSINVCVCELVFESLHAIDTFTKRKSVNKQRDKARKQDINRILLDSDSLGFESLGFGILNCPSLFAALNTLTVLSYSQTILFFLCRLFSLLSYLSHKVSCRAGTVHSIVQLFFRLRQMCDYCSFFFQAPTPLMHQPSGVRYFSDLKFELLNQK